VDFSVSEVQQKFKTLFKNDPLIVRSPGRINLIGEHTDYNDGFVMPASIDRETIFAVAESGDQSVIYSMKYDEFFMVDIQNPQPVKGPAWVNYLLGVLRQLVDQGHTIKPFHCVFGGNIPLGAGLSSSASVEGGFAFAINTLFGFQIPKLELVHMAQWSEHHFVGVKCGIMDQFASIMGAKEKVLLLDCRSLEYRYLPLNLQHYAILLCDTKVKHSLVSSEYNTRRAECEEGVRVLKSKDPSIKSLRDVTKDMLIGHKDKLKEKVFNRCWYVVEEIERVQQAAHDLENNNLKSFGARMFQTHDGLSRLYEVSCPELDFLVDEVKGIPAVIGARMMGGGFGGCTINLVEKSQVNAVIQQLKASYQKAFSIRLETYTVNVQEGTGVYHQPIEKINLL